MTTRSRRASTPRQRIEAECVRRSAPSVVAGCCRLIRGETTDDAFVLALGGPHAERLLDTDVRSGQEYWLRVWGTRGLLWVWDDAAWPALLIALRDPAWRVREMAAKVVARHQLGDAFPMLLELRDDPVPRVRAAAARATATLIRFGA